MNARLRSLLGAAFAGALLAAPAGAQNGAGGALASDAAAVANKLSNGGFEVQKPSYWAPTGAGATWSATQFRSESRSLALGGAGAAAWTMGEAVRNWVDFFGPRGAGGAFTPGEIVVGGYLKADGVNVNPTTDAGKFQLVFEFLSAAGGTNVIGQPIVLDLPQTASTTAGFVRFDNTALGAITIPAKAASARVTFRKGASATGTMYLDDAFIQSPGGGSYVGTLHGNSFDQGDTWYYYIDGIDNGFPSSAALPNGQNVSNGVSAATARTGALGLRMKRNGPVGQGETVAISQRVAATPGQPVLVSFWTRTAGNASPETIGTGDNNIGMTTLWYNNLVAGAAGYGEIGGADVRFNGEYNPLVIPQQPKTAASPWTRHAVVFYPREGSVGMEVRLRYWHQVTGEAHFDDVSITNLGLAALATAIEDEEGAGVPEGGMLLAAYPNPARGAAMLGFRLRHAGPATLEVYNVLGQRVASLLDGAMMTPGTHEARFDADGLPSGTYLYVLRAGGRMESRTLVLVK